MVLSKYLRRLSSMAGGSVSLAPSMIMLQDDACRISAL